MTATTEVPLRTWYEPTTDAGTLGNCYCSNRAVGYTTYFDGHRRKVLLHCAEHLPEQGGGQS